MPTASSPLASSFQGSQTSLTPRIDVDLRSNVSQPSASYTQAQNDAAIRLCQFESTDIERWTAYIDDLQTLRALNESERKSLLDQKRRIYKFGHSRPSLRRPAVTEQQRLERKRKASPSVSFTSPSSTRRQTSPRQTRRSTAATSLTLITQGPASQEGRERGGAVRNAETAQAPQTRALEQYQCTRCSESFKHDSALKDHFKRKHERVLEIDCRHCGKIWYTHRTFTDHHECHARAEQNCQFKLKRGNRIHNHHCTVVRDLPRKVAYGCCLCAAPFSAFEPYLCHLVGHRDWRGAFDAARKLELSINNEILGLLRQPTMKRAWESKSSRSVHYKWANEDAMILKAQLETGCVRGKPLTDEAVASELASTALQSASAELRSSPARQQLTQEMVETIRQPSGVTSALEDRHGEQWTPLPDVPRNSPFYPETAIERRQSMRGARRLLQGKTQNLGPRSQSRRSGSDTPVAANLSPVPSPERDAIHADMFETEPSNIIDPEDMEV